MRCIILGPVSQLYGPIIDFLGMNKSVVAIQCHERGWYTAHAAAVLKEYVQIKKWGNVEKLNLGCIYNRIIL